jgi:hypothetical protein
MAVEYTGRNSSVYRQEEYQQIKNGTLLTSELALRISDNQTWLAVQDIPAINFFQSKSGFAWSSLDGRCKVRMPPFSTHIEVWFWLKRNDTTSVSEPPWVEIESTATGYISRMNLIAGGQALGDHSSTDNISSAEWVCFTGIIEPEVGDRKPRALKLRATAANTWFEDTMKYRASSNVLIYAAYYRAIPQAGPLISQS